MNKNITVAFYISENGEVLHKRRIKGYRSYEKIACKFGSNLYVCIKDNKVVNIDFDVKDVKIDEYDAIVYYIIGVEPVLMAKLDIENHSIIFYNNTHFSKELANIFCTLNNEKIDDNNYKYFATEDYEDDFQYFSTLDEFRLQISYVLSSSNLIVGVADGKKEVCTINNTKGENPYLILKGSAYKSEKVMMFIDMFNNMYS